MKRRTQEQKYGWRAGRLGNSLLGYESRPNKRKVAVGDLATGVGIYLGARAFFGAALEDLRTAADYGRQAILTGVDLTRGYSLPHKEARELNHALSLLEEAAEGDPNAVAKIRASETIREELCEGLLREYQEKETRARLYERMKFQAVGTTDSWARAVGKGEQLIDDTLVPGEFLKKWDEGYVRVIGPLAKLLGGLKESNMESAKDAEAKLKRIYSEIGKEFYDQLEKHGLNIEAVAEHAQKNFDETTRQIENLRRIFPGLIESTRQGFTVEDYVIALGKKQANASWEEIEGTGVDVKEYSGKIDKEVEIVTEVAQAPREPIGRDIVYALTNADTFAVATTLVLYGAKQAARRVIPFVSGLVRKLDDHLMNIPGEVVRRTLNIPGYVGGLAAKVLSRKKAIANDIPVLEDLKGNRESGEEEL